MSEPVNFGELLGSVGSLAMEPVPAGVYDARVIEATAGQSSTGKLMYKLRYEIIGPTAVGRKVYNNITLTTDNANALRMFFVNMKAMGLEESYFATSPTPHAVAGALLGRQCKLTIKHKEYPPGSGLMREDISGIAPSSGVPGVGVPVAAGPGPGIPAPIVPAPAAPVVPVAAPAPAVAAPVATTPEPAPVVAETAVVPPAPAPEPAPPAESTAPIPEPQGSMPAPPPVPF